MSSLKTFVYKDTISSSIEIDYTLKRNEVIYHELFSERSKFCWLINSAVLDKLTSFLNNWSWCPEQQMQQKFKIAAKTTAVK